MPATAKHNKIRLTSWRMWRTTTKKWLVATCKFRCVFFLPLFKRQCELFDCQSDIFGVVCIFYLMTFNTSLNICSCTIYVWYNAFDGNDHRHQQTFNQHSSLSLSGVVCLTVCLSKVVDWNEPKVSDMTIVCDC